MNNLKKKVCYTQTLIKSFLITVFSIALVNIQTINAITYNNGTIGVAQKTTIGEANIDMIGNTIFGRLSTILNGCIGIALITLTLVFVIKCGQIAASADNAMKRSNHLGGMLWVLISIGVLGMFSASNGIFQIITQLSTKGVY